MLQSTLLFGFATSQTHVIGTSSLRDLFLNWSQWHAHGENEKPKQGARDRELVTIPHVSFNYPLIDPDADDVKSDWNYHGAAYPSKNGAILLPNVLDRVGSIWAAQAFKADSFTASVAFRISLESFAAKPVSDGGWGIWFQNADFSPAPNFNGAKVADLKTYYKGNPTPGGYLRSLQEEDFGFFGHPHRWDGFGILFRSFINGQAKPGISIVTNFKNGTNFGQNNIHPEPRYTKPIDTRGFKDHAYGVIRLQVKDRRGLRVMANIWPNRQEGTKDHWDKLKNGWVEIGRARIPDARRWDFGITGFAGNAYPNTRADAVKILGVKISSSDIEAEEQAMKDLEEEEKRMRELRDQQVEKEKREKEERERRQKEKEANDPRGTPQTPPPPPKKDQWSSPQDLEMMDKEEKEAKALHKQVLELKRVLKAPSNVDEHVRLINDCLSVMDNFKSMQDLSMRINYRKFSHAMTKIGSVNTNLHKLKNEVTVILGKKKIKGNSSSDQLKNHIRSISQQMENASKENLKLTENFAGAMEKQLNQQKDLKQQQRETSEIIKITHGIMSEKAAENNNRVFMVLLFLVIIMMILMGFVYKRLKAHEKRNYLD